MRSQLPYVAATAAAVTAAYALKGVALGDVGKVVVVGLAAIVALYVAEYLLGRRR